MEDVILESVLTKPLGQRLELLLDALLLSGLSFTIKVESLLGNLMELLSLELWQGGGGILVHILGQEDNLVVLLQKLLDEGGGGDLFLGPTRDVVD